MIDKQESYEQLVEGFMIAIRAKYHTATNEVFINMRSGDSMDKQAEIAKATKELERIHNQERVEVKQWFDMLPCDIQYYIVKNSTGNILTARMFSHCFDDNMNLYIKLIS